MIFSYPSQDADVRAGSGSGEVLFVTSGVIDGELVREMAPDGLTLTVAEPGSVAYERALGRAEYLVGFVDMLVAEELFAAAPKLTLIQCLTAGYDRADIEAARRAGVPIATNGGANANAVAEHAILLMLAVSRELPRQHVDVCSGRWRRRVTPSFHELGGRTLGIVGLGTIGKRTAQLARAFGMNVYYYDVVRLADSDERALEISFRLLNELLSSSDIISLHVPLNDRTREMIGPEQLAIMRSTAILVNTSRGAVVDEAALVSALKSGAITGAGLDVYAQEPPSIDNPLLGLENVVLTAHLAGPTQNSIVSRLRNGFDNVERCVRGEPPLWVIPEMRLHAARWNTF